MTRLADIEARLASLEREAALLRRFGDDTRLVVGDVIRFTKTHHAVDGTVSAYTYAALKTPAGWYLTARHHKPVVTYDELIAFIVQHPLAEDVEVAVSWVDVTEVHAVKAVPDPLSRGSLVSTSAPADDSDAVPLSRRRAVEFGRGLYRPVKDDVPETLRDADVDQ